MLLRQATWVILWIGVAGWALADGDPRDGYSSFETLSGRLTKAAENEAIEVRSLVKTAADRDVWLATIGDEDVQAKPAILVVGNVDARHLVGSELALGLIESIARRSEEDSIRELLARVTLYVIPRPNPDGSERFFANPLHEVAGSARKTDDDRDHAFGEDPPDDLNGDGLITSMRIEDPAGAYLVLPGEPRLMVKADPKKGEVGTHRLLIEGIDDDHDDAWNEDGGFGVSFNRNMPAKYPYFGIAAGPNQVSEPETRAVIDFCFDHPNIAAVVCFTPEDNLFFPPKPAKDEKVKTTIQEEDAGPFEFLAERYQELHGGKKPPKPPEAAGSFADWSYLQFGRWTFAARAWWVPPPPPKKPDDEEADDEEPAKPADKEEKADDDSDDKKKDDDKREEDAKRALAWFEEAGIDGFVPWTKVEHPDFPDQLVEVGGFRPGILLNPPSREIEKLIPPHVDFLIEIGHKLPRLEVVTASAEALGEGAYRVKVKIANTGFLPTMSKMGVVAGTVYPLNWTLTLPDGATLVAGNRRGQVESLGPAEPKELEWLVTAGPEQAIQFEIVSPSVGKVTRSIATGGQP